LSDGSGQFNDGRTAARHQVTVRLNGGGINIISETAGILAQWPYATLRTIDPPRPDAPLRLTAKSTPDARLLLSDPVFVEALRHRAPHLFLRGLAQPNVARNMGYILLAMLALGLLLWQGVPRLSAPLARLIPLHWERDIGVNIRDRLLDGAKLCSTADGDLAVTRLTTRVIGNPDQPPDLIVTIADSDMVNAFALRGGHIIVMRGLLQTARNAEEIAAVLAHEIGHASLRHPTQMAIRALGIGLIADLLTGDGSALVEFAGQAGGVLLLLSYSREMERQADAYGRKLLRQAGLPTAAMAQFFARLHDKAATNQGSEYFGYLSSHPPLEERITATNEGVDNSMDKGKAEQHALAPDAWRALQSICG